MTQTPDDPQETLAQVVADFHLDHANRASPVQRTIDRMTNAIGRPPMVVAVIALFGLWAGADFLRADGGAPDFDVIDLCGTLTALGVSLLILGTQRREDQLAERRAKLMLELALLTDKKNAKIIALLEEIRRDAPYLASRDDPESDLMQTPADPLAMLEKIEQHTQAGKTA